MLEIFRDRDRQPLRDMVPWAGEFAGKYLTSAVQILLLWHEESGDKKGLASATKHCRSDLPKVFGKYT